MGRRAASLARALPVRDIWPSLLRVVEAFTLQRLMLASDWTNCRELHSYAEAVFYLRDTAELGEADKQQMFAQTAWVPPARAASRGWATRLTRATYVRARTFRTLSCERRRTRLASTRSAFDRSRRRSRTHRRPEIVVTDHARAVGHDRRRPADGISNSDVHTLARRFRDWDVYPARDCESRCTPRSPDIFVTYDWSYSFFDLQEAAYGGLWYIRDELMRRHPSIHQLDIEDLLVDEVTLWIDFVFINQSARDVRAELDVMPALIDSSKLHFALSHTV